MEIQVRVIVQQERTVTESVERMVSIDVDDFTYGDLRRFADGDLTYLDDYVGEENLASDGFDLVGWDIDVASVRDALATLGVRPSPPIVLAPPAPVTEVTLLTTRPTAVKFTEVI